MASSGQMTAIVWIDPSVLLHSWGHGYGVVATFGSQYRCHEHSSAISGGDACFHFLECTLRGGAGPRGPSCDLLRSCQTFCHRGGAVCLQQRHCPRLTMGVSVLGRSTKY